MIKIYLVNISVCFNLLPKLILGQQRSHLLFKDNLIHFNPAHAGVDESKIQIGSRSQWLGIKMPLG